VLKYSGDAINIIAAFRNCSVFLENVGQTFICINDQLPWLARHGYIKFLQILITFYSDSKFHSLIERERELLASKR
jgi:hypothetical protein